MPVRIGFDVKVQGDGSYVGSNPSVGLLVVAGTLDELSLRIEAALASLVAHLRSELGAEETEAYFLNRGIKVEPVTHAHSSDIRLELPLSLSA